MAEEYKIRLGVELNTDDILSEINKAEGKVDPIKIKVDAETKELTNTIRDALRNLSNGTKNALTLDTGKIEASLKDVSSTIKSIKTSLSTVDGKSGMKSLLSSINQISTALDKATSKFDELNAELKALSSKDFSINLGVNLGGSNPIGRNAAYGNKVRNETLPQLKQQAEALENYLKEYYKVADGFSAMRAGRTPFDLLPQMLDNSGSLSSRMTAYKEYIAFIKEAANIRNIDLSHITSGFSKTSDELVKDAQDIQTGAKEMEDGFERLKQVFGGGSLDIESLSTSLKPIVEDLAAIRRAIEELSSGVSVEGLTQSFDRLSDAIEKLVQNAAQVKDVLGDGLNTAVSDSGTEKAIQDQKELAQVSSQTANAVVQSEERKQQAIKETADESKKAVDSSLAKEAEKINKKLSGSDLGFSKYDNEIDNVTTKFNKLENQSEQLQTDIRLLNTAFSDIKTASTANDTEALVNANKEYEQILTRVKNQLDINSRAEKEAAAAAKKEAAETAKAEKEAAAAAKKMQKEADDAALKETNAELTKLKNLAHQIGNLDFKIVKSDYNDEIEKVREFERQLELVKKQYNETVKALADKGINIGDIATPEFIKARNDIAEFEAQVEVTKRKLAEKLQLKLDTGDFTAEITKITTNYNKLSIKSEDIENDISSLNQQLANMNTAAASGDIEALTNAYKEYERILESVNNKLDINKVKQQEANRQQKQNNDLQKLEQDKVNFAKEIDIYLQKNTAAAKQFGDAIRKIRAAIDSCDDSTALNNLKAQFKGVQSEAKLTLNSTQSFGDKLKKQWEQYSSYLSVASLFMYAEQGLRSMFEQVKLIDSAMTELKKVTNETDAVYSKFLSNAADRAKEIGTTIDGLVSSTADFARLGYGFEDAQGLAEVANIYAVVGDEIEGVEGATESLISTMAAFKDEMNGMSNTDFAMSIIDKFNEIGNNFSISSGGIGEALERSASSLMAANNTIDESIALITAANTVVQDPTQVGKDYADIKSGYIG